MMRLIRQEVAEYQHYDYDTHKERVEHRDQMKADGWEVHYWGQATFFTVYRRVVK